MSRSMLGVLRNWYRSVLLKSSAEYHNRVKLFCQRVIANRRRKEACAVRAFLPAVGMESLESRVMLSGTVLGDVDAAGVLTLNMGPRAADRVEGNTEDVAETFTIKQDTNGDILLSFEDTIDQRFAGVTSIVGYGGLENDTLIIDTELGAVTVPIEFEGNEGDDTINGGDSDDTFYGGEGNDTINGGAGNDTVFANAGNDIIDGGEGNDIIHGHDGDDTINGGAGDDTLYGGDGSDRYVFLDNWGNDTYVDEVAEGAVNELDFYYLTDEYGLEVDIDTVDDGEISVTSPAVPVSDPADPADTPDTVSGRTDVIRKIWGGSGDDSFAINDGGNFEGKLEGYSGDNTLDYSGWTTAVTVDFENQTATGVNEPAVGEDAEASIFNFNTVIGTVGDDTLIGSDVGETFHTGGGEDDVTGAGGADTFYIASGTGSVLGGSGNDTFMLEDGAAFDGTIDGGEDSNTLDYSLWTTDVVVDLSTDSATGVNGGAADGLKDIENVTGGAGNDTLTGSDEANNIDGGAGNDTLAGGLGADNYIFRDGWGVDTYTDVVEADVLNQLLFGYLTADVGIDVAIDAANIAVTSSDGDTVAGAVDVIGSVQGGSGDDSFAINDGGNFDGKIHGSGGNNELDYSLWTTDVEINTTTGTATGVNGGEADSISGINVLRGGAANNILTGSSADEEFHVSGTMDTIDGVSGNNTFYINTGAGSVLGGWGDDTFVVADGADFAGTLDGGFGNNTLDYSAWTTDIVIDLPAGSATGINGGAADSVSNVNSVILGGGNNTLTGTDADEEFYTTAGSDTINGMGGNDTFHIISGHVVLDGGEGDDTFIVEDGAVNTGSIAGGEGVNTFDYSEWTTDIVVNLETGSVTGLNGGAVDSFDDINRFFSGSGNDIITGTEADPAVEGSGEDVLVGAAGNDIIDGLSGNDVLYGQDGNDTLTGGDGDDYLSGDNDPNEQSEWEGPYDDTLDGGAGNDDYIFYDNWGVDTFADVAEAGVINQLVFDGVTAAYDLDVNIGEDQIVIESYQDGELAGDKLTGATAPINVIWGGAGDDSFAIPDIAVYNGSIKAGAGINSLDLSTWTTGITVDLAAGQATGFNDGQTGSLTGISKLQGTEYNDLLFGSDANEEFYANGGDDIIYGYGGNDIFHLGLGQTFVDGGAGDDYYYINMAVENRTTYELDATAPATPTQGPDTRVNPELEIIDSDGNDTVDFRDTAAGANGEGLNINLKSTAWQKAFVGSPDFKLRLNGEMEIIHGTEGHDNITLGTYGYMAYGYGGNDTIIGSKYGDRIEGGDGDDNIQGGHGDDYIDGGEGNDTINGSNGNDTIYGQAGDDVIQAGRGNDFIYDGDGNDSVSVLTDQDTIYAGYGEDKYYGSGKDDVLSYAMFDNNVGVDINLSKSTVVSNNAALETNVVNDRITGIFIVYGTEYADKMTSSGSKQSYLTGLGGDDEYHGNSYQPAVFYLAPDSGTDIVNAKHFKDVATLVVAGNDKAAGVELSQQPGGKIVEIKVSDIEDDGTWTNTHSVGTVTNLKTLDLDLSGSTTDNVVKASGIDNERLMYSNVYFGSGNDTFYGSQNTTDASNILFTVVGGEGDDFFYSSGRASIYIGGNGEDTVSYENATNGIVGDFKRMYNGINGRDELYEIDAIHGSNKDDVIAGSRAGDTIHGNGGNDILKGKRGNDTIYGGAGNDVIFGGNDDDRLFGEAGEDRIHGDADNDTINGGDDDDIIVGQRGVNTFTYETGNDTVHAGPADTLDLSDSPVGVQVDLLNGTATIGGDVKILRGVHNVIGSEHADTITGSNYANIIDGGQGVDTIDSMGGNDTLIWANGDGTDATFEAGTGRNTLLVTGSTGADTFNVGTAADEMVYGGMTFDLSQYAYMEIDALAGHDTLNVGGNLDTLQRVTANMGSGNDTINGQATTVPIWAYGESGDDDFFSGQGDDIFDGGTGTDTADYSNSTGGISGTTEGRMRDGYGRSSDKLSNIDILNGSNNDDKITGGNKNSNLTINGKGGDDKLTARYNDTTLNGDAGNDTLRGGGSYTYLNGGAGDDTITAGGKTGSRIIGGAGDDTITGKANKVEHVVTYEGAAEGIEVDLTLKADNVTGGVDVGTDTLKNVYAIIGTNDKDIMTAGSRGQWFKGLAGNDELNGGRGDDVFVWGINDGADDIDAGEGRKNRLEITNDTAQSTLYVDIAAAGTTVNVDAYSDEAKTVEEGSLTNATGINQLVYNGSGAVDVVDVTVTGTTVTTVTANLGGGNDVLTSNGPEKLKTYIYGEAGDDTLTTGGSTDTLYGGAGDDTLDGGAGKDKLIGGDGGDTYILGDGKGRDTIEEKNPGWDWIDFSGSNVGVNMRLTGSSTYTAMKDSVSIRGTITRVIGTQFDDVITGSRYSDVIIAGQGDDILKGSSGADLLIGGEANIDNGTINFETTLNDGTDTLYGGKDNDFIVGGSDNDTLYGEAGNDILVGGWLTGDGSSYDVYVGPENDGDDMLDGGKDTDELVGCGGNDTLVAMAGSDHLFGGYAQFDSQRQHMIQVDTNENADGNDIITISSKSNSMAWGGNGNDTITTDNVESMIFAGLGDDTDISGKARIMHGWYGNDEIIATGATNMFGGFGDDDLYDSPGDDYIDFGAGANTLNRTGGTDTVLLGPDASVIKIDGITIVDELTEQYNILNVFNS